MSRLFIVLTLIVCLVFSPFAESSAETGTDIVKYDSLSDLRFLIVEKKNDLRELEQKYRNRDAISMGLVIGGMILGSVAFYSHSRMDVSYAQYQASSNTVNLRTYRSDTEFWNVSRLSLAGTGILTGLTGTGIGVSSAFLIKDIDQLKQEIFQLETELTAVESTIGEAAE